MRSVTGILFSLRIFSSGFETDGIHEFVKIVDDALVEAIQLRTLLLLQSVVAGNGGEQAGGQGRVDPLEQFQEYEADGEAFARQAVAARAPNFPHEALGPQF